MSNHSFFAVSSPLRALMNKFTPSVAGHGNSVAAVTLALLLGVCGSAHSTPLIQITPDDPSTTGSGSVVSSSGWNVLKPAYADLPGRGLSDYGVTNLLDSNGNSTVISLAADDTNRFNAYNPNGSLTAGPGFPADVKRESFFGNDVSFNGFTRPIATWVFGGFNPNDNLTFTFFASRMAADTDNREGKYEVVGATTVSTTLNATNNESNTASVRVKADASGNVVLNMTKGPNNTNSFGYFYLSAMTIAFNAPTISDVADWATDEDTSTAALAFTVGDLETAVDDLSVSAASDNTALVPLTNIVFGGSGANRNVTITPAANQTGSATITLTVSDGVLTTSDTFVLTVNAGNDVPVAMADGYSTAEDVAINFAAVDLTTNDSAGPANESTQTLTVTAVSAASTQGGTVTLVAGQITYTPPADFSGSDSFSYTVADNGSPVENATGTVNVTVSPAPVNDYNAWNTENSITDGPGVDSDGDGISNIIEYIIGGDPSEQMDVALLPSVKLVTADPDGDLTTSSYLLFTYRRTVRAANNPAVGIKVEWSTNLISPWQNAAETSGVVILPEPLVTGIETVKVYIPVSPGAGSKRFVRLAGAFAG